MSRADRILVLALAVALLLMLWLVLEPGGPAGGPAGSALAGEARDLDVDLLRRRILAGDLSEEEALYWHPGR